MPLPLIPIAIAAMAGAGGAGIGSLMGGKKETHETEIAYSPTYTEGARTMTYQPVYSPQSSYVYQGATYQIESPGARSKKEANVEQRADIEPIAKVTAPVTAKPSVVQGMTEGTDMVMLAAIAAIAVIGGSYFMGGKKGK